MLGEGTEKLDGRDGGKCEGSGYFQSQIICLCFVLAGLSPGGGLFCV